MRFSCLHFDVYQGVFTVDVIVADVDVLAYETVKSVTGFATDCSFFNVVLVALA